MLIILCFLLIFKTHFMHELLQKKAGKLFCFPAAVQRAQNRTLHGYKGFNGPYVRKNG